MSQTDEISSEKGPLDDDLSEIIISSLPDLSKHTLSILGLTYIVRNFEGLWWKGCCFRPKRVKAVLKNVSMHLKSGELTAILGNSGSGKTTLLDIISCRVNGQTVGGTYIDGKLMTSEIFRSQAGYVIQSDHLLPNLTVRETLTFVAQLKFSLVSAMEIKSRVEDVLAMMSIRHVADSKIGGSIKRGISGGERRRVTVALQLLQDPNVLLLDEPTTGLDSFTAHYLVKTLSNLAKKYNKIILMTIHQPRSDILPLFDNVGILSKGEMMYIGPANQLTGYFTSLGYPCPRHRNPLDHYLDLVSFDHRSSQREEESKIRLERLKKSFIESGVFRGTLSDIHICCHFQDRLELYEVNPLRVPAPPGYFSILGALVARMALNTYRDFPLFMTRFFELGFFGVLMFIFIFQLQHNPESIQDRIGILFQASQVAAYVGLILSISHFPPLREMYYRDIQDGLYGPLVFMNAYFILILPFTFISSFVFTTFTYWAMGMYPEPSRYGIFLCVMFLLNYGGEVLAVLFMGIMNNVNVAMSIVSLILALTGMLSSGFLRSLENMLPVLQKLAYGTVFKYTSEILVANEFHGLEMDCGNPSYNYSKCLVPNGDLIIDYMYPGAVEKMPINFCVVGAFTFAYVVLAILVFRVMGIRLLR